MNSPKNLRCNDVVYIIDEDKVRKTTVEYVGEAGFYIAEGFSYDTDNNTISTYELCPVDFGERWFVSLDELITKLSEDNLTADLDAMIWDGQTYYCDIIDDEDDSWGDEE